MDNSGSTKIVITASALAVAATVVGGLYSLCSGSRSDSDSDSGSVPNSSELDSVQSNSSPVSNSHDSGGLDILQPSAGSVSNSYESGLIDLLSVSASADRSGFIGWQFPPIGWVKCNVDGSSRIAKHSAGCGGVYRDEEGKWVNGFARKLGYCGSMKAEIFAICTGLTEAWRLGIRRLIIESDSKSAVDLVNRGYSTSGKLTSSIRKARKYLILEWEVNIVYIPREYNCVADWLSKFSHELEVGTHELKRPPKGCRKFLLADTSNAIYLPRSVVSNFYF